MVPLSTTKKTKKVRNYGAIGISSLRRSCLLLLSCMYVIVGETAEVKPCPGANATIPNWNEDNLAVADVRCKESAETYIEHRTRSGYPLETVRTKMAKYPRSKLFRVDVSSRIIPTTLSNQRHEGYYNEGNLQTRWNGIYLKDFFGVNMDDRVHYNFFSKWGDNMTSGGRTSLAMRMEKVPMLYNLDFEPKEDRINIEYEHREVTEIYYKEGAEFSTATWDSLAALTNSMLLVSRFSYDKRRRDGHVIHKEEIEVKFPIAFYLYAKKKGTAKAKNVIVIPSFYFYEYPVDVVATMFKLKKHLSKEDFTKSFGHAVTHYFYNKLQSVEVEEEKILPTGTLYDPPYPIPDIFVKTTSRVDVFDWSNRYTVNFAVSLLQDKYEEWEKCGLCSAPGSGKSTSAITLSSLHKEVVDVSEAMAAVDTYQEMTDKKLTVMKTNIAKLNASVSSHAIIMSDMRKELDEKDRELYMDPKMPGKRRPKVEVLKDTTTKLKEEVKKLLERMDKEVPTRAQHEELNRKVQIVSNQTVILQNSIGNTSIRVTGLETKLNGVDFSEWYDVLVGRPLGTKALSNIPGRLRRMIHEEVQNQLVMRDPAATIVFPRHLHRPVEQALAGSGSGVYTFWTDQPWEEKIRQRNKEKRIGPLKEHRYLENLMNRTRLGIETKDWGYGYVFESSFEHVYVFKKPKVKKPEGRTYSCGTEPTRCQIRGGASASVPTGECDISLTGQEAILYEELINMYRFCQSLSQDLLNREQVADTLLMKIEEEFKLSRGKRQILIGIALTAAVVALLASAGAAAMSYRALTKVNELESHVEHLMAGLEDLQTRFKASSQIMASVQKMMLKETSRNAALIEALAKDASATRDMVNKISQTQAFQDIKTASLTETLMHVTDAIAKAHFRGLELSLILSELGVWRRSEIQLEQGFLPVELVTQEALKKTLVSVEEALTDSAFKLAFNDSQLASYYALPLANSLETDEVILIRLSVPLLRRANNLTQPVRLVSLKTKDVPCEEKMCGAERGNFMRLELPAHPVLDTPGVMGIIHSQDLSCITKGEDRICFTFMPNVVEGPDKCLKQVLNWNEEEIRQHCTVVLSPPSEVIYTPVRITKDYFTIHRDALEGKRIILSEVNNGVKSSYKLNVTAYCHHLKLGAKGRATDELGRWTLYNVENLIRDDGWELKSPDIMTAAEEEMSALTAMNVTTFVQRVQQTLNLTHTGYLNRTKEYALSRQDALFKKIKVNTFNISREIEKYEEITGGTGFNFAYRKWSLSISKYTLLWFQQSVRLLSKIPGWFSTLCVFFMMFRANKLRAKNAAFVVIVDGMVVNLVDAQMIGSVVPFIYTIDMIFSVVFCVVFVVLLYWAYTKGLTRYVEIEHFEGEIQPRGKDPTGQGDPNGHLVGRLTFNLTRHGFFKERHQQITLWFPLTTITQQKWVCATVYSPSTFILSKPASNSWYMATPVRARFFDKEGKCCHDSVVPELSKIHLKNLQWYRKKRPRRIFRPFIEECRVEVIRDGRVFAALN